MNVKVRDEEYLFVLLSEDIKERLIILLISQCILHAIPETIEEMNVSTLQEDIVKLNKLLNDLHFFDDNQVSTIPFILNQTLFKCLFVGKSFI